MPLIHAVVVLALALTSGLQYLVLAVAAAVVAAALCAFAATLWLLAQGLRRRGKQWARFVVAAEIVLAPIGAILFWLESQAQTTDNPFPRVGPGSSPSSASSWLHPGRLLSPFFSGIREQAPQVNDGNRGTGDPSGRLLT